MQNIENKDGVGWGCGTAVLTLLILAVQCSMVAFPTQHLQSANTKQIYCQLMLSQVVREIANKLNAYNGLEKKLNLQVVPCRKAISHRATILTQSVHLTTSCLCSVT